MNSQKDIESEVVVQDKEMEECGCYCHREPGTLHVIPCCKNDSKLISKYEKKKKGFFDFLKKENNE